MSVLLKLGVVDFGIVSGIHGDFWDDFHLFDRSPGEVDIEI